MEKKIYESSSCIENIEVMCTDNGYVLYMVVGTQGEAELHLGYTVDEVGATLSQSTGLLPEFIRRDILKAVKTDLG